MPHNSTPADHFGAPMSRPSEPDAHGQAALLLAESTLHALTEAGILTVDQAIGAVRTASEVKVEIAGETGESSERMRQSISLLNAIELSLTTGTEAT